MSPTKDGENWRTGRSVSAPSERKHDAGNSFYGLLLMWLMGAVCRKFREEGDLVSNVQSSRISVFRGYICINLGAHWLLSDDEWPFMGNRTHFGELRLQAPPLLLSAFNLLVLVIILLVSDPTGVGRSMQDAPIKTEILKAGFYKTGQVLIKKKLTRMELCLETLGAELLLCRFSGSYMDFSCRHWISGPRLRPPCSVHTLQSD